jgi:glutathione peroxidase
MSTSELDTIALKRADGGTTSLADYAGKVVLVVNVASKCGFTPQYAALEKIYEDKQGAGLVVLGFPTGNFAQQEFDTDAEIATFCSTTYGVSFPVLSKISVAGGDQHPLYSGLTRAVPEAQGIEEFREQMKKYKMELPPAPAILWTFEKFLLNRKGEVVGRFAPNIAPDDARLVAAIDAELAKS